MTNLTSNPPDICLILRAHAEQLYLTAHVLPTLRQLERAGALLEHDAGSALAYLEVLWLDARQRAEESDGAHAELLENGEGCDPILFERARRYHVAVRRLRSAIAARVAALTGAVA
jgi:hypothetical protein